MKRKLLLTVMLVIASVWTQSAWAQSWTGCEVKSGYALLYNVGTEKFFTRGNNWDTRASVGDYGAAMTVSLDPVGSYFKIRTTNTYGVESLNGGTVYTDQARGKNSTWEFVEVDAVNHIYNIVSRDNHEAGSGAYLTAEGGSSTIVGPGSDGTSTNAQWKVFMIDDMPDVMQSEMTNASATNPVDVSVFIKDATFASYGEMANSVWANNGGCNLNGGSMTNPCAEKWCGSFSITQTISNVPNGKYQMTGQAFYRIDGSAQNSMPVIFINDETSEFPLRAGTENNMNDASASFASGTYPIDPVTVVVENNTITLGARYDKGDKWCIWDNFQLFYLGPVISSVAVELPANGDMVADTWYYIDIPIAGDAYNATATNLADIVYTTDGTKDVDDATITDQFLATNNSLQATRYYVKSTTDNNLAIATTSYSYNVSAPTVSPAEGSVIKPGQIITVTFEATTNDPTASPTQNFGAVRFGGSTVTVTPTANGFTYEVPSDVTAGTSYTLDIPEGAVQYTGKAVSPTATFTYSTPAFFDGVYYVRNADPSYEYKYIACQGAWATQASVQDYGLAVHLSIDGQGRTRMQFFDTEQWLGDNGNCYTDCDDGRSRYYSVEPQGDGTYKFLNTNNTLYLAVYQGGVVGDAAEGGNLEGSTNLWILDTPAEYAQNCIARQAQKQIEDVATAAGLTGITSAADLEAAFTLSTDVALPTIARQNVTNAQIYEKYDGNGFTPRPLLAEQTVTGLSDGVYKLTFKGFQRAANYARVDAGEGARGEIYVYANNTKQTLVSVMEEGAATAYASNYASTRTGLNYPNDASSAYAAFDAGLYKNEIYVYVTGGTLNFGIATPRRSPNNDDCWTAFGDFELTYFLNDLGPLVSEYEAALAAAKTTSAKTDKMAASLRTALDGTIDTYDEGKVDETSQAALEEAINALKAATAKSETSIASYAIIEGGSLPNNSVEGWAKNNQGDLKINTWSNESNNDGGSGFDQPWIENWLYRGETAFLGAGELFYHLEGLEPGEVYYIEMNARACRELDSTIPVDPVFYVNNETVALADVGTTHVHNNMGILWGTVGAGATIGADGVLEFGIRNTSACNYNWNAVKDVKITTYDAALAQAIADLQALEDKVPSGAYNDAAADITACQGTNYPTTAAEFETAINNLRQDVTDLTPLVEPFAGYLKLKEYADFNVAADCDDTGAQQDFSVNIGNAQTAANAATTAAEIEAANEQLRTDMDDFVDNTNPIDDGKYNLTYKLTYPDVTECASWNPVPGGWFTDQADGNFQVMNNDAATSEDGTKTKFVEYWTAIAQHNGLFDLYTTLTLTEGTYQMSCWAFAKDEGRREEGHESDPTQAGVYFYVNETQGSLVANDRLEQKEVEFVNPSAGDVNIGLKATDPNTYNWVGIGYVELYKVPANEIVIDADEGDYDYTQNKAGLVKLYRSFSQGYNSIVLPFNMTGDEVKQYIDPEAKIAVLKFYDNEKTHLAFNWQDGISANQPCIIQVSQAYGDIDNSYEFEIPNRMLIPADDAIQTFTVTGATMYGTYEAQTYIPAYNWFFQGGNMVYAVDDNSCWVNTTRCYINLEGWAPDPSGVKGLTVTFDDDEATGIAIIENGNLNILTGKIYDISGREVQKPTRGIYIIDGKKVMIK